MNVREFRHRFAALSYGHSFVYFTGNLSCAEAFASGRTNLSVKLLKREARRLYESGEAVLAQRRLPDSGAACFEYIIWRCGVRSAETSRGMRGGRQTGYLS